MASLPLCGFASSPARALSGFDNGDRDRRRTLHAHSVDTEERAVLRPLPGRLRGAQRPDELWDALSASGDVGVAVPEEWGGGGLDMRSLAIVVEEVGATMGFLPVMLVVSAVITGPILAHHGSEPQKERWLAGIAAGATRVAFAITEPDAGSNSHRLLTSLRRDADAILVVARFQDADGTLGAPTLCLVGADAPDLTREAIPMASTAHESRFQLFRDDSAVPADRRRERRPGADLRRPEPRTHRRRGDVLRSRQARSCARGRQRP